MNSDAAADDTVVTPGYRQEPQVSLDATRPCCVDWRSAGMEGWSASLQFALLTLTSPAPLREVALTWPDDFETKFSPVAHDISSANQDK